MEALPHPTARSVLPRVRLCSTGSCPALSHFPEFPGSADPEGERSGKWKPLMFQSTWKTHFLLLHRWHKMHKATAYFIIWFEYCILLFVSYCQSQDSEMPFHLTFPDKFQKVVWACVFSLKALSPSTLLSISLMWQVYKSTLCCHTQACSFHSRWGEVSGTVMYSFSLLFPSRLGIHTPSHSTFRSYRKR